MFSRLVTFIAFVFVLAAVTLELRQRQLQTVNAMAATHRQYENQRRQVWSLTTTLAGQLSPRTLQASLAHSELQLEPIVDNSSANDSTSTQARAAQHDR